MFAVATTTTFFGALASSASIQAPIPSGSFILGTLVSLEIKTGNGTIAFVGTVDAVTEVINGTYNIFGGTCDQTGTAVLALGGQWDYH